LIAAAKELRDLAFQVGKWTIGYRPSRIDNDVPRRGQFGEPGSHHFANAPLESIADDGFSDGTRGGEADAGRRTRSSQTESRKERS
jgi:hypothetical protein